MGAPTSHTDPAYDVTVILCTLNRGTLLADALQKVATVIRDNAPAKVELLVVDNGSTDDTPAVIQQFITANPDIAAHTVREPKRGLATARNAGMKHGQGRILMFCDDDAELAPDFFTVLLKLFAADKAPVMRGGRVLLGNPQDLPYTIKTETEPATYNGRYPGGFIHGCCMAFSRKIYERIGPMDDRFSNSATFPSADESDYIHRAYKAGFQVLFCPEMYVYHFHGRRDPADIRRLFERYMIGDGALFAKHWNNGLLRCLIGNVFHALRSFVMDVKPFDAAMGFTYRDAALGNLRGFIMYWRKG